MNFRNLLARAAIAALGLLGAGQALAERTTTYYHTDGLGSVVAATNQAGQVLWRKDYAPFGEQIDDTPDTERMSYTGKQHDDVTGLTYFGARYYDPEIGRFLSVDPTGFVESNTMSFNRYLYVNNNPYKYVDPDGEFLNFALKFVLDVGLNVAVNYLTTGELHVGAAIAESAIGMLNPAKTLATAGKLVAFMAKGSKVEKAIVKEAKAITCALSCFVAGTTVLTEHGYLPIETLKVGDKVWAHDPDTGVTELKPIVRTYVNTHDTVWQLVVEKDGVRYLHEVTGSHPYHVLDDGAGHWVEVAQLEPGMLVEAEGGGSAHIISLNDTGAVLTTYNLEVKDIHTYYVGAAQVLVHNCGGGVAKLVKGGETAATKAGREAHKAYENTLGGGYTFNKALPSGKRPDAIDWVNRVVRELKPGNARGVARGQKQVAGYKKELEQMTGQKWTSHVDTYNTPK